MTGWDDAAARRGHHPDRGIGRATFAAMLLLASLAPAHTIGPATRINARVSAQPFNARAPAQPVGGRVHMQAPLTPAEQRRLARTLVCPERLPDDATRTRIVDKFFDAYGRIRPGSHAGERMSYRDTILRQKRCRPQRRGLIHTFPES